LAATSPEKVRYVALMWGAMLGPAGFARLLRHFGSATNVLHATPEELQAPGLRLTPGQATVIPTLADRLDQFSSQLEDLRGENIRTLCDWQEDYPALLAEARNPPPVVCIAGAILPEDDPAIAIVGTRTPTAEGLRLAREMGRAFAAEATTVVSGLASGCDTAAHTGALEGGGRTIAVLGSGIRVIQPRENLRLAREVFRRGAIVSEQPPHAHATTGTLMARNRLQSALARGVLAIEAAEQGGTMETAKQAVDQGRLLYAMRWPQATERSAGPERLLSQGARPVGGPRDAPAIRLELADHLPRVRERAARKRSQMSLFED